MFAIADYYIYCFLLRNNKYMDLVTCNALKLSMIMLLSNKNRSGMEKLNRRVVSLLIFYPYPYEYTQHN